MNVLGVGPLEIVLVLILALLVLGPEGMVNGGRQAGKFLRKLYASDFWKTVRGSRNMMDRVVSEMGMDKDVEDIRSQLRELDHPRMEGVEPGSSAHRPNQTNQDSPSTDETPAAQPVLHDEEGSGDSPDEVESQVSG